MRPATACSRRSAFTLIEFLVVIGIITFLAALTVLLGPVLQQAHDSAARMGGIATLHDLGADLEERATATEALLDDTEAEMWRTLLDQEVNPFAIDSLLRRSSEEVDRLTSLLQAMAEIRPSLRTAEERLALGDGLRSAWSLRWITCRLAELLSLLLDCESPLAAFDHAGTQL